MPLLAMAQYFELFIFMLMRTRILFIASIIIFSSAMAQQAEKVNYSLAAKFSPKRLEKMIFSTSVDPHWLKSGDRFWYEYETSDRKRWYIVDAAKGTKREMFDTDKMAADITRIVKDPYDGQNLKIDSLEFVKNETAIQFTVKSSVEIEKKDTTKKPVETKKEPKIHYFEYDLQSGLLTELIGENRPHRRKEWANISPDQKIILFSRNHNLYWMDSANYRKAQIKEDDSTIVEHQLTFDGEEDFAYGGGRNETNVEKEKNKKNRKGVGAYWSPDSKHFAMIRSDNRKVKDLWVINSVAQPRPTLETYKYQMPGEKESPVRHLYVFNISDTSRRVIDASAYKDQELGMWSRPAVKSSRDDKHRPSVWQGTNDFFFMSRTSRDLKKIDVCRVDIKSGKVTTVINEVLNTYVDINRPGLINGGKELIQWSERDGWGHLYLYDETGKLKNQITSGPWHVEDIVEIDEKNRTLYFSANGREKGEDPYYVHLYRVGLDGNGLKNLNPGDFDHQVSINDNAKFFVSNRSRVNTIPESTLFDATGRKILDLEKADLTNLFAAGYQFPEPFKVKAADGRTDLFGTIYKPFDFDSTRKYPIIEYVYPGPQTESVNKAFGRSMDRIDRLAQVGFIVITVGNRGGHPARSKWYHNYGYGNLRDYGLADKKAAAEQLADRHAFIDINRVGIHGHSGGGFMSTAALLVYPDFFKVGVSSAGNHENNIYNRWWSEKHHGVKEVISDKGDTSFVYAIEKNPDLAKNLKGHLMISTGDIDNNVHPANTIRMANALIKANKRFEFLLLPGQRHGYGDMSEYYFWKMADFYSRHLLGNNNLPVDMVEMNNEVEQTGNKK
jgi:dipeptidyl-peptidase 4